MCGIAGFFNFIDGSEVIPSSLVQILSAMRYRGPDHLGTFFHKEVGLGNVRLSILGLSEQSNQPVFNEDKTVVAVYNGEIYNFRAIRQNLEAKGHRLYTQTDSEILVHLYEDLGEEMAQPLNGMFAFALFDIPRRMLILGRDRSGQKPLYLHFSKTGVFFSSELKAMLPFLENSELDPVAIRTFLSMGYVLEPATIVKGVSTLEPGSIRLFSSRETRAKTFWKIDRQEKAITTVEDWLEKARAVFPRAIHRHLESDVPVTMFLSGGLDSSLLASFLARENRIKTAFTGSFSDAGDHDEFVYSRQLGAHYGFDVQRVDLNMQTLAANLESFLSSSSMPQGDFSGLAMYCLAKETANSFRVVFGGDGADELFGGYPTYTLPYLRSRLPFLPTPAISLAHRVIAGCISKAQYLSLPLQFQQLAQAWSKPLIHAHFALKNFLPPKLAEAILRETHSDRFPLGTPDDFLVLGHQVPALDGQYPKSAMDGTFLKGVPATDGQYPKSAMDGTFLKGAFPDSTVKRLLWLDFTTFLRSGTIPKAERNCMIHSLENRLPFLDNEVIDLGLATDENLLVQGTQTKVLLRRLLSEMLPGHQGLNPRKQGFSPPLVQLFGAGLKDWLTHWLESQPGFLEKDFARAVTRWEAHGFDLHRLKWNLAVLADWSHRNHVR